MVRSLLLATSFPPAVGGMETLLYQTARRLAEPPLVLAAAPIQRSHHGPRGQVPEARRSFQRLTQESNRSLEVLPVRTRVLDRALYRPLWYLHPSLAFLSAFWRPAVHAIATHRPRVLQVGHVYLAPLGRLLARRFRLPYVVYGYGQEVWRAGRSVGRAVLDARLRGRALAHASAVFSPGTFTAGLLAEWGVRPERIVPVAYGADPQPPAAPPSGCDLLSVARLVPRKGVDTVISALSRIAPSVQYRVVGSGPDEARLRDLARTLGVADRVQFLGRLDDSQLAQEYQRCALFVLPSRRTDDGQLEGLGLVYFEAAAWGRPVVAGRSGGEVDAVVDGETGVLVDGTSATSVADAIGRLLADPARLQALGAAGRRRVETTHNWTRAAATVDATLGRLAASR